MITDKENQFPDQMKKIMNMVRLNDYSNNLEEHFNNLIEFMKKKKNHVTVSETSKGDNFIRF